MRAEDGRRHSRGATQDRQRAYFDGGNYTFLENISNAQGSDAPLGFAGEEPYAVEIAKERHGIVFCSSTPLPSPLKTPDVSVLPDWGPWRDPER